MDDGTEPEKTCDALSVSDSSPSGAGLDRGEANFPPTRWTLLCSADSAHTNSTTRFLTELGGRYWYPLYAYLRRKGHSAHDAQDLTQGFFAELIAGDGLKGADSAKGRFRSYLLGALNHHVSKVRAKASAQKRGGGNIPVSIDQELAEKRYQNEPSDSETPESAFHRRWAIAFFQQARNLLEQEYWSNGKGQVFEALGIYLTGEAERGTYGVAARTLETTEVNVRTAVKRMRKRYRDLLIQQVEMLVDEEDDPEEEIRFLIGAMT